MNKHVTASPGSWDLPLPSADFLAKHPPEEIALWEHLITRVMAAASANGFTKAQVTRRSGMKEGTFSQWFSGSYLGVLVNQNRQIAQWLDALEEAVGLTGQIMAPPAFLHLRGAREIADTLHWAQTAGDMVMITIGAGMGKTATCRRYAATRPHVYHATVSPHTKTVHGMLVELAAEIDVREHNPAKLTRAIGARLARIGGGTLLIVDEAQNLVDDAINQLRHFMDIYGCGIALVGNEEVYSRFNGTGQKGEGPSYAQLKSRIGKRLKRVRPHLEDLQAYIAAWGISDPDIVKILVGIGSKGGAFRQIEKTLQGAFLQALGAQEELALKHVRAAWTGRDVEELS